MMKKNWRRPRDEQPVCERIYFVQCDGRRGPIKIGRAVDVQVRVSHLQVGCPFDLEVLVDFPTEDAQGVEAGLHERFRSARIRGEWFAFSEELIELVNEHRARLGLLAPAKPGPVEFTWRGRRRRW